MKCKNCGSDIPVKCAVCPYCGARNSSGARSSKKKSSGKKPVIAVATVLAAAVALASFTAAAIIRRGTVSSTLSPAVVSESELTTVTTTRFLTEAAAVTPAEAASETQAEEETESTAEQADSASIRKKFEEFLKYYSTFYTFAGAYSIRSEKEYTQYGKDIFKINYPGVNSKADLKNLFLNYCTEEYYNTFTIAPWEYRDYGGQLYIFAEGLSVPDWYYSETVSVTKKSETLYIIVSKHLVLGNGDPAEFDYFSWDCRLTDGRWLLTGDTLLQTTEMGQFCEPVLHCRVQTKGSPLNVREAPSVSAPAVDSLPVGYQVEVDQRLGEWSSVQYTTASGKYVHGWVKSEYLVNQ